MLGVFLQTSPDEAQTLYSWAQARGFAPNADGVKRAALQAAKKATAPQGLAAAALEWAKSNPQHVAAFARALRQ